MTHSNNNTGDEKMADTTTINCPKCSGKGYIDGLSHYANGVCFACNGAKTITVDIDEQKAKISDEQKVKADWILNSTPESYAGLSYGRLLKIRDFAHGGWGLQYAYPTMLAHYREVGEPAFQAAQEAKLEAFYASRN